MEGGGGSAGGGDVLGAAREPREQQQPQRQREEEKGAGGAVTERRGGGAGGGMKFRVSARAPHGVGALLLIGGVAVVGAAVLAWRRSRRGKKGAERQSDRQTAKDAVLDGRVGEEWKVQDGALVQKLDQSNEKLIAGNTEIGSGRLDGKEIEESHQIHKDNEIVADQLDSKHEEKIDQNSGRNTVEVSMDYTDKEHVQKSDQNSSRNHVEITTHDMFQDNEHVEIIDQDSSRNPVEVMPEVITVCLVPGNVEKVDEDSSRNNIEKHISQKDNNDVKASDESKLRISGPGIIFSKNNDESDGIQEAESMDNCYDREYVYKEEEARRDRDGRGSRRYVFIDESDQLANIVYVC